MTSKPDDVSRLDPTKRIGEEQKMGTPSQSFEQYMQKEGKGIEGQEPHGKTPNVSPFDLAHGQTTLTATPTFDTLLTQVKSTQTLLGDVNTNINTKNLKLKQSQRYLLRNKLTDANTHLRAANSKLGVEPPAPPPPSSGGGIIGKFIDYISEGNANLESASKQILSLKAKGDNLKPADFLTAQLKLAAAQQEIEYASIMLSKAVEDMKMLFNVQL